MDNPYKISFFIILTTMLSILFANMETLEIHVILAQDKEKNSNETGDIKNTETPSIELTGKLVNNTYRWMDSNDTVNPVLNIVLGQDNKITIKSLPDDPEEHEFTNTSRSMRSTCWLALAMWKRKMMFFRSVRAR
jgi:hypothetical protein